MVNTPILVNININKENEIIKEVRSRIRQNQKDSKSDIFAIAQANYDYFIKTLAETTNASNMQKIKRLFIKPRFSYEGYINPDTKLIYTYPEKGTTKVRNITPWIIKQVIENGGKVTILKDDKYKEAPDISAELRYPKKQPQENNLDKIKEWALKRDGKPAIVSGTSDLLRIKFSQDEEALEEISWDKFFSILEDNNLLFVYDKDEESRFCTFVGK